MVSQVQNNYTSASCCITTVQMKRTIKHSISGAQPNPIAKILSTFGQGKGGFSCNVQCASINFLLFCTIFFEEKTPCTTTFVSICFIAWHTILRKLLVGVKIGDWRNNDCSPNFGTPKWILDVIRGLQVLKCPNYIRQKQSFLLIHQNFVPPILPAIR